MGVYVIRQGLLSCWAIDKSTVKKKSDNVLRESHGTFNIQRP
jgi:hypothetical protein